MSHFKTSWNSFEKSDKNANKLIIQRKGTNLLTGLSAYNSFLSPVQKLGQKRSLSTSAMINRANLGGARPDLNIIFSMSRQRNNISYDYCPRKNPQRVQKCSKELDRQNKDCSLSFGLKKSHSSYFHNTSNTYTNTYSNDNLNQNRGQPMPTFNLNLQRKGTTLHKNGKNTQELKSQFRQNMQNLAIVQQTRKKYQRQIEELKLHLKDSQENNLKLIQKRDQDLFLISNQNQEILRLQHQLRTIQKHYEQEKSEFIFCQCEREDLVREWKNKQARLLEDNRRANLECQKWRREGQKYKLQLQTFQKVLNQRKSRLIETQTQKGSQKGRLKENMKANLKEQEEFKIGFLLNQINQYRNREIDKIDALLKF